MTVCPKVESQRSIRGTPSTATLNLATTPETKETMTVDESDWVINRVTRRMAVTGLIAAPLVGAFERSSYVFRRSGSKVVSFDEIKSSDFGPRETQLVLRDRDNAVLVECFGSKLDQLGNDVWWTTSNNGARTWRMQPTDVMTPEMFGEIADNVGDAVPPINAALRFLADAGGGTLRFVKGKTYRLESFDSTSRRSFESYDASIVFPGNARNLRLELNDCILSQACDAYTIGAGYSLFTERPVMQHLLELSNPLRRGDRETLLKRPADGLKPGDMVMLVAGNTFRSDRAVNYAPIAEMLVVDAISGRRISFTDPVAKYYSNDGRNPFGLLPANDISIRDCAVIGPGSIINRYRRTGNVMQAYGFELRGVKSLGRGGFALRGRKISAIENEAYLHPDWSKPLFRPYALAIDMGSCEILIDGLKADGGSSIAILHFHEGIADLVARNITIRNGTQRMADQPWACVSILSTSWNVSVSDVTIINNPDGAGLEARSTQANGLGNENLTLSNIRFEGSFRRFPLIIQDTNKPKITAIDFTQVRKAPQNRMMVVLGSSPDLSKIRGLRQPLPRD